MVQAVTLLACIREVAVTRSILAKYFRGSPQSLQMNAVTTLK
jgi:hypothetical protein